MTHNNKVHLSRTVVTTPEHLVELVYAKSVHEAVERQLGQDDLKQVIAYLLATPTEAELELDELLSRSTSTLLVKAATLDQAISILMDILAGDNHRLIQPALDVVAGLDDPSAVKDGSDTQASHSVPVVLVQVDNAAFVFVDRHPDTA